MQEMMKSIKLLGCSGLLMFFSTLNTSCTVTKQASHFRLILKDYYCISNINAAFIGITPYFNSPDSLFKMTHC
ncbi:hypothetical protein ABIB39_002888 [Mucilaginibacter sp. UYP27]